MAELNGVRPVNQRSVTISESFFKNLMRLASENIIPYQWEALNDNVPGAEPSYCIRNLRAAAGRIKEPHGGCVFQDSDLFKWIEAAAYMLMWKEDPETERHIDETVQLMEEAQQPDGYLDTYYILTGLDKRWTNLRDNHELYCAGHLIEAAVAYFRATGKRRLLDVAIRYVDCIDARFGPEDGKVKGYPGHEEIELALVKLYEVTGDEKHLKLAHYFIEQRGQKPLYFDIEAEKRGDGQGWSRGPYSGNRYYQAGAPVREQKKALGHAVRQGYLLSGMADVARETGDKSLTEACKTMWKDIPRRQMYITGAIGILPDICNTVQILLASLLIVLPLGVGAAVYLTEYAQNKKLVAAIEYAAETLSGIPSIIYGLVGMLFFCEFLGMQTSLLAGALTLVIMNLPTVLRTTQESLRTVPQSYREGAFGLGAGKWRVVRTVVLPGCIDGIVTGCILSAGRILGESAALLFTAGFAHTLNKFVIGLASPGATLTVALYAYAKEEGEFDVAFAIAAILMILTLLINLAAGIVGKQIQKRSQQ